MVAVELGVTLALADMPSALATLGESSVSRATQAQANTERVRLVEDI